MEFKTDDLLQGGHLSDKAAAIMVDTLLHGQAPGAVVPGEVLDHVEECGQCKDKILDVATFLRNPDAAGVVGLQRETQENENEGALRKYFHPGKIAAAAVVCAFLLSAYFFLQKNPGMISPDHYLTDAADDYTQTPPIQKETETADSKDIKSKKEEKTEAGQPIEPKTDRPDAGKKKSLRLPPPRYRVNPNLESMTGSRLRAGLFELSTPSNNSVLTVPIHFSWKKELPKPYTLKIVDNRNNVIYRYTVQGRSFDFTEKLPPGLYYWKMESQNELLYVGKFFINTQPLH